jgi:hypothetical protein
MTNMKEDVDGSDPNVIAIVITKLTGNDFVDENFVPGIGVSISGTVSDNTNNDDAGNMNLEGMMVMLKVGMATLLRLFISSPN